TGSPIVGWRMAHTLATLRAGQKVDGETAQGRSLPAAPLSSTRVLLRVLLLQAGGVARAGVRIQLHLADPDEVRRDLDALVFAGELQALLERQLARRRHPLEGVRSRLAHVGQLLLLRDVDVHVVGAGVLAD